MIEKEKLFIVAIGFSSGGIGDLYDFFSEIPPNSNAVFIIIQHLWRHSSSKADQLLSRHTHMPVSWATDHHKVEANHIYMLPVNKFMTIENGYLETYDRDPLDKSNWAVNIFFHSMADNVKAMGVGIILSGAGSDGTLGAIHMHQENGTIMVQNPETAQFEGMPNSVILKDHPHKILAPKKLAAALMEFLQK